MEYVVKDLTDSFPPAIGDRITTNGILGHMLSNLSLTTSPQIVAMTARKKKEPWQTLRVGDRVRIVRLPYYADMPDRSFHPETRRLYKRLIARRRSLRVYEVDEEYGLPWIACRFRMANGRWEYHTLAINDDSWVRVDRDAKH